MAGGGKTRSAVGRTGRTPVAELPPFRKAARCDKCGGSDVSSSFHRAADSGYYCNGIGNSVCRDTWGVWERPEHLKRRCRRCGYEWLEAPIGAGAKP